MAVAGAQDEKTDTECASRSAHESMNGLNGSLVVARGVWALNSSYGSANIRCSKRSKSVSRQKQKCWKAEQGFLANHAPRAEYLTAHYTRKRMRAPTPTGALKGCLGRNLSARIRSAHTVQGYVAAKTHRTNAKCVQKTCCLQTGATIDNHSR